MQYLQFKDNYGVGEYEVVRLKNEEYLGRIVFDDWYDDWIFMSYPARSLTWYELAEIAVYISGIPAHFEKFPVCKK